MFSSFLRVAWQKDRPGEQKLFNKKTCPLLVPPVPQQENGSDCGVFLLHYAEKFCTNPNIKKVGSHILCVIV
jgi:Ulp1 family protease